MKYMYDYKEAYGNVFFTDIPIRKLIHGYSEKQVTISNFDKSTILQELSKKISFNQTGSTLQFYQLLLGEWQFAFILFYLGQNYEGFEQWKKIVYLLSNCEEAISSHKDLFMNFIPVLYEQLDQLPIDFFDDQTPGGTYFEPHKRGSKVSSIRDNFIFDSLNTFYEICMSEPTDGRKVSKKIKARVSKLKSLMEEKFNIDISTENERLCNLIAKSKDISIMESISKEDGTLTNREEQVINNMNVDREDTDNDMVIDNENTYDNEETQGQNRISAKDIEVLRKQMAIEDDEYLPCIVDLNEKLITFE